MKIPGNLFKQSLLAGKHQKGLWATLASAYSTEVVAGAGFDWLLLDMEHSPNEMDTILQQLQTVAAYDVHPVVRPVWNDPLAIKRLLDIGAQTLLIPYVQNRAEAEQAVQATRYPPRGIRGVSAVTRATRFGRVENYLQSCEDDICLLLQVETQSALDEIEAIASVEGVDGIFIGPADLSTSLGYPGQLEHPVVMGAIEDAIQRIQACKKAAGILTTDTALARHFIQKGTLFTAVGVDAALLARAADDLAARF
jgi:4-hydroxy-2-oxoheptanedioate aldolase